MFATMLGVVKQERKEKKFYVINIFNGELQEFTQKIVYILCIYTILI